MTFEDLDARRKARLLVKAVYALTREPALVRDFGLCGQIQRAAVSVMSNVAEGFERTHGAEKLEAYNIARASCGEVRSLLYVIEDNYSTKAPAVSEARVLIGDTGSLVSGLIASTRRRLAGKIAGSAALIVLVGWWGLRLLS
ncbi:MAG: four helix bundle protein [Verrucomicrobia bacterium]|nr:four helix bundle protein [Verrucomicrobiota bacterium]